MTVLTRSVSAMQRQAELEQLVHVSAVPDSKAGAREFAIAVSELVTGNRNSGSFSSGYKQSNGSLTAESIRSLGREGYISALLRKATPQDKAESIALAQAWFERDDLLSDLTNIVLDFTMAGLGFHIQASASEKDFDYSETVDLLRKFQRRFDLRKVIKDLLKDWRLTDNMILYWKMKTDTSNSVNPETISDADIPDISKLGLYADVIPGLVDISALNPSDVDWNNSLGNNILSVKMPVELIDRINKAIIADSVRPLAQVHKLANNTTLKVEEHIRSLIISGVNIRWIEAVAMGNNKVELSNDDGDYWIIKTKQRKHHGLAKPSMSTIFIALKTRELLSEGEFTAAYITKHFIMLIQGGEGIQTGPLAGSRNNYLQPQEAKDLDAKFSDISMAMKVVTDHTVKISFVFPPAEFFNPKKFENCEGRILNWVGVTYAITEGEGGNYGSGFIGIKRLLGSMLDSRSEVTDLVTMFFDHESIRDHINIPEDADVIATFDEQILKEPVQLLKEIEFLVQSAIMDSRTAATELGRNPDRLRQSKSRTREEDEEDGSWSPVNSEDKDADKPSIIDQGGRPANPETTQNENTRIQTGSPAT